MDLLRSKMRAGKLEGRLTQVQMLGRLLSSRHRPVELAGRWVEQYGLGLAVITLGPGGGVAVKPGGHIARVPGFPAKVVDTVGAGDTFMAGFLDGYVKLQLGIEGALQRGAAAASIVCSRRGPQPPTSAEVDDLIAEKA